MPQKAPKSYLNARRPTLLEALKLEPGTIAEATKSLEQKGYFEPPAGPWTVGSHSRGHGAVDFAVLDRFGDMVVKVNDISVAELIVEAVNAYRKK